MSLFLYVLADIIHQFNILILCDMFFSFRKRLKHNLLAVVAAGIITSMASAFIFINNKESIEVGIYFLVSVLVVCMFYKEKLLRLFFMGVWGVLTVSMLDIMAGALVKMLLRLMEVDGESFNNLCIAVITFLLVYIVGRTYKKNALVGINSIGIKNLFWFTFLMFVDTAVVTVVEFTSLDLILEKQRNIYLLSVVLVIIGIFIQLAAVILLFTQRNVYKEKKQLTEKYLNEQKSHYEYLEKRERETKKFRHDFRSHLELISNMAQNHDVEKIHSYLEKLHIKVEELGNVVTVQNGIVDAILNQYYAKALQCGITMEVKGRFPGDSEIDAYDICTIFSNILSNAIEAATEAEEKFVSVECRYNERNIIIVVKNSFRREQQNASSMLKTKKEDLDYHGYGLSNMKDSVDKYNGVFDIEIKDGRFVLTILFNCIGK